MRLRSIEAVPAVPLGYGKLDDTQRYRQLFGEIRTAFAKQFLASDRTIGTGSQTANVLGLHIGLAPLGSTPSWRRW